jgi:protein-S-isoprenylcysteine O-methyltransferase Ste14
VAAPQWVFVGEYVILFAIRFWYGRRNWAKKVVSQQLDFADRFLMFATLVGFMILPPVYLFTGWLDFANYDQPAWLAWLGIPVAAATVWLFWRSHADLGTNWSPTLELREGHDLVTRGVYRRMRHPMYASIWLWSASQALLLPNWLVGLAGLATFAPMYFRRVPREEKMMRDAFGASYEAYMAASGRILPRLGKQ